MKLNQPRNFYVYGMGFNFEVFVHLEGLVKSIKTTSRRVNANRKLFWMNIILLYKECQCIAIANIRHYYCSYS